jgi:hypothetical protein
MARRVGSTRASQADEVMDNVYLTSYVTAKVHSSSVAVRKITMMSNAIATGAAHATTSLRHAGGSGASTAGSRVSGATSTRSP